ncbi:FecR family protein [Nostoc sp. CHAB 5715]|uniref:FecR family protein n=1 Tax=Nostoc sp. CHAB 5715 TaxID=2780400 RepID=UPI001E40CEE7|nr:FecR family protein [Nostoc sp. CHAB 5715]MCC5623703.1 FecR domain-containing protein [Nostoc sp. CHAB 5715]
MFYKSFPLLVIALWGVLVVPLPNKVSAITPLTRGEIQNLRNMVQLIPKDKLNKRPARKLDAITPGDGLSTGRASLADLRFNDGSLARVGEQALFQFLPKTRDFKLSNGTVLLLIPPGRGQTRIQTPSAAAAIRGSALFVRYDQQTDTTIVGALTNSGIEVSNKEGETKVLEAGQMIILIKGEFQNLYDFDLRNFYETSEMVRELDLNRQSPVATPDPAITSVQAETTAALEAQPPIKGEGVIENPSFVQLTPSLSNSPSSNDVIKDNSSANSSDSEKTGQASTNTNQQSVSGNSTKINTENSNVSVDSSPNLTTPQNSSTENPTNKNPQNNTLPISPTEPTPVIPTEPTPVTPTEPTPVTPTEPTPVTPTEPTPVTPTEPTPVTPTEPTPVTPTEPTPVTPTEPTPVTPTEPTPVTPTEPTPVTPTDLPST